MLKLNANGKIPDVDANGPRFTATAKPVRQLPLRHADLKPA